MFSGFLKFFNSPVQYDIYGSEYRTFVIAFGGMQFGRGVFSVFDRGDIRYWERIIKKAFPEYKEKFDLLGHDWLGRCFALETSPEGIEKIVIFDPGVLEIYDVPLTFMDFINKAIPFSTNDCLAIDSFVKWYQNGGCELEYKQCVGYKKPLFMGGEESLDNLEIMKLEGCWRKAVKAVKQEDGTYVMTEDEEEYNKTAGDEEDKYFARQADDAEDFFMLQKKRGFYIKKNVDKYLEKFKTMERKGTGISWNWCAFLFNTAWLFYRKMYWLCVLFLVLPLLLGYGAGFGIGYIVGISGGSEELAYLLANSVSIVLGIIMVLIVGMFGNSWYRNKIDKLVAAGESAETEEEQAKVLKKGGTNIVGLIAAEVIGIVLSIAVIVLMF